MPRTEYENVFVGRNPDTNRPYFERRKKKKTPINPSIPPEEPPLDPSLLTPEQWEAEQRRQREEAFERHQASRPDLYPPED